MGKACLEKRPQADACTSLQVGIQLIPALTTKSLQTTLSNGSFTESQAYFEVVC